METEIITIGNSKCLVLSQNILDRYNIQNKIEMILKDDHIILKSTYNPRKGWYNEFKKMNQRDDDKLLISDIFEDETFE